MVIAAILLCAIIVLVTYFSDKLTRAEKKQNELLHELKQKKEYPKLKIESLKKANEFYLKKLSNEYPNDINLIAVDYCFSNVEFLDNYVLSYNQASLRQAVLERKCPSDIDYYRWKNILESVAYSEKDIKDSIIAKENGWRIYY